MKAPHETTAATTMTSTAAARATAVTVVVGLTVRMYAAIETFSITPNFMKTTASPPIIKRREEDVRMRAK